MKYLLTLEYNSETHNQSPGWAETHMDRICREVITTGDQYNRSIQYKSWWWGYHQCKVLKVRRVL